MYLILVLRNRNTPAPLDDVRYSIDQSKEVVGVPNDLCDAPSIADNEQTNVVSSTWSQLNNCPHNKHSRVDLHQCGHNTR